MAATKISQKVKSPQLTGRQMDCAILAAKGMTSKEIARQLNISPSTVDTHLSTVLARYNLKKRSEISLFFQESVRNSTEEQLILNQGNPDLAEKSQSFAVDNWSDSQQSGLGRSFAFTGQTLERTVFAAIIAFVIWYLKF